MPLEKQPVNINFSQGLNTKTDPFQLPPGQFLRLQNTVFDVGNLLKKRNGYQEIGTINSSYKYLTTFSGNLTAIGNNLAAYSTATDSFVPKGNTVQAQLSTLPLVRSNSSQSQCDAAIASNGLVCTVYTDTIPSTAYKYVVADSVTGQNIIAPTVIPSASEGPRVFVLGAYFIILYSETANIKYIAVPFNNPGVPSAATTLVTNYTAAGTALAFDGVIANNNLYVAYNGSDGGGAIRMTYLNAFLVRQTAATGTNVANAQACTLMSICADMTGVNPVIWLAFSLTSSTTIYTLAVSPTLVSVLAKTTVNSATTALNITCAAQNNLIYIYADQASNYAWDSSIPNRYTAIHIRTVAGVLIDQRVLMYGVGLASKAFILESEPAPANFFGIFASGATTISVSSTTGLRVGQYLADKTTAGNIDSGTQITAINGNSLTINKTTVGASAASPGDVLAISRPIYLMVAYDSDYQPSYFLIDAIILPTTYPNIVAKVAYSNGGGYLSKGLPNVTFIGSVASVPYLFKDMITPVNRNTNIPTGSQSVGIYAQLGINLVNFDFTSEDMNSVEIGQNLSLSGGIIRSYDGYTVSEQGFHLYPDLDLHTPGDQTTYQGLTTSTSGGSLADQKYFYVATYEWADNQGNLWRSAPSIPVAITTAGGNTSTNTIKVPTLRLTAKLSNPVKIVVYRWSTAQQVYYQVTSVTAPTLNDTTANSVTITDTFADATILGNSILYTTGGVVENIAAPAARALALYKSRQFSISAEDENILNYSKQVIQTVPVETSDLFTLFVAPTSGAQGSTGGMKCIAPMDDKLMIFKSNAIYYLVGNGPDNTGANNDFSDPVFVTSTVGCSNQNSIVFIPNGLMFQSNKGIWLLGRDLTTQYIGAPVEAFNSSKVLSANVIPGTNQVRFTLDSGEVLMYDYFYNQWGIFKGIANISSTLFEEKHTFLDSYGRIYQENPGSYLDGSRPVLIDFLMGWANLAGLQGFERAYFFYILATYLSPHKLTCTVAYDYNSSPAQSTVITPDNFSGDFGSDPIYGNDSPMGGPDKIEQWRVFFQRQKCQAFQIGITESYDSSLGAPAGAGFTMSGLNLVVGLKKAYNTLKAARSVG